MQRIGYWSAVGVLALEFQRAEEPLASRQEGFASVPCEGEGVGVAAGDVLPRALLQKFKAHARLASAVHVGFVEVVAVGAVEVAGRAYGFEHEAESAGGASRRLAESYVLLV